MPRVPKPREFIRRTLLASPFIVLAIVPKIVSANELQAYSYHERTSRADVVLIGKALSSSDLPGCCNNFAAIGVIRVMKGHASRIVRVFTQDQVIDYDPSCCKVGKTYLFFLSSRRREPYAIVDGHFGAIPLD